MCIYVIENTIHETVRLQSRGTCVVFQRSWDIILVDLALGPTVNSVYFCFNPCV
jgi:hypothetical protein